MDTAESTSGGQEERPPFRCSYTENEVKELGIVELGEILEDNGICFDKLETENEMQELVISLMKKGNGVNKKTKSPKPNHEILFTSTASQKGAETIKGILEKDSERKKCLIELYEEIMKFMKDESLDLKLKDEIQTEFGDVGIEVGRYKEELLEEQCPIVVAGETTAGKSSLLNLLLGSDVLPHSLLTCTTTICRLWNKETKAVFVVDQQDKVRDLELPKDMDAAYLKEELQKCVVSEATENKYKFVDVHWPIPILQKQAIIVDTPGIGSNKELTQRLYDYLPSAIAFIYVINSSNAGGVQSDRLLKIFEAQKKEGKMYEFDPTRAIFVCNKWDQVSAMEDRKVWEDTAEKLMDSWPNFTRSQMYKLSTKEEMRRAATPGLEYTQNFQKLLDGIAEMIPASLEAKVSRHLRWQNSFLDQLLRRIVSRIKLSRKDEEEKKKMKVDIEERIKKLQHNIKEVKEKVKSKAESLCNKISNDLHNHLLSKETRSKMFLWKVSELPIGSDYEVIEYQAKKLIVERINSETRAWCTRENVNNITKELTKMFREECKIIDEEHSDINNALMDVSMPLEDGLRDFNSSADMTVADPLFTTHEKIVLAVTAPLWFPLVIGAGLLALPFGVAAGVKDVVKQSRKIKEYDSNKLKFMMDWSNEVLDEYDNKAIYKIMEETYLTDFNVKVEHVCENVIPNQIDADKKFIDNIKNELRSSCQIRKQYRPLEVSCKVMLGKLYLLQLEHFSGYRLPGTKIRKGGEEIGQGNFSDVHSAEVFFDEKWMKAAVKTLRSPLEKTQSYIQLTEVHNLRKLHHPNIVQLYGVSYRRGSGCKKFLQIYMELCDYSLDSIVYSNKNKEGKPLPCHLFKDVSQCKESWEFYLQMMCGVAKGLIHIHSKGLVHRDLKMANIMVRNGEAKIADVGLAKDVDNILGTVTGTPTTMAPEVLEGKFYGAEVDIYSFGIILWEMWYGRPAYTDPLKEGETEYTFIAKNFTDLAYHINKGTRPDFGTKYKPKNNLEFLMKKCWDAGIANRPSAQEVLQSLEKIKSQ